MDADDLVEGWTDPINHILKADGAVLALTGYSVVLLMWDKTDTAVTFTGTVSVPDAAAGKVRFSPAATDLIASKAPYRIRWKVTDGSSKIAFFPNERAWQWNVRLP